MKYLHLLSTFVSTAPFIRMVAATNLPTSLRGSVGEHFISSEENASTNNKDECAFQPDLSTPISRDLAIKMTKQDFCPCTLVHIVTFKFNDDVTQDQIDEVEQRVLDLKTTALRDGKPYIEGVTIGAQNSYERLDNDHQLGFVMTFKSQGDRNFYVGTPLLAEEDSDLYCQPHDEFKDFVGPLIDEVFVYDYCAVGEIDYIPQTFV